MLEAKPPQTFARFAGSDPLRAWLGGEERAREEGAKGFFGDFLLGDAGPVLLMMLRWGFIVGFLMFYMVFMVFLICSCFLGDFFNLGPYYSRPFCYFFTIFSRLFFGKSKTKFELIRLHSGFFRKEAGRFGMVWVAKQAGLNFGDTTRWRFFLRHCPH